MAEQKKDLIEPIDATFDDVANAIAGTRAVESKPEPKGIIAGTPDSPLRIGGVEIDCYVLEGEQRVLSQRGMVRGLGFTRGSPSRAGAGAELPRFATQKWIEPFLSNDLVQALSNPVVFANPAGGGIAFGYPATILADICDAILEAERQGVTTDRQAGIVEQATNLMRGFARVGIVALVDEATGYQELRAREALADILQTFLSDYKQKWAPTFPEDFYRQIYRLRGWEWKPWSTKRPSVIGKWTDDFVYERIAPGLTEELRRLNPTNPSGERLSKHHQWFNPEFGHPKLREHISGVVALMRAAGSWDGFRRALDRAYPRFGATIEMSLDEPD